MEQEELGDGKQYYIQVSRVRWTPKAGGAQGIRRPPQLFSAPVRNAQGIDQEQCSFPPLSACGGIRQYRVSRSHNARLNAVRYDNRPRCSLTYAAQCGAFKMRGGDRAGPLGPFVFQWGVTAWGRLARFWSCVTLQNHERYHIRVRCLT